MLRWMREERGERRVKREEVGCKLTARTNKLCERDK